jgi:FlaA1/EpsC-like NDP-sugar epimerase
MRVIYCAGEQGRVVLDILRSTGEHEDIVFGDDDPDLHGESVAGRSAVGGIDELAFREETIMRLIEYIKF